MRGDFGTDSVAVSSGITGPINFEEILKFYVQKALVDLKNRNQAVSKPACFKG